MSLVETIQHAEHAYFDSAVMLIFFLLCGRYLDHAMRGRTRSVAGNLAALKAETARRIGPSGEALVVPVAVLQSGDRIMVLVGERVPADGILRSGKSRLDDSLITGETILRSGHRGSAALCGQPERRRCDRNGSCRGGGRARCSRRSNGCWNALSRRSRAMCSWRTALRAIMHRSSTPPRPSPRWDGSSPERSVHDAIIIAVSVLIITCPCALALAVPAVQVVAAGQTVSRGRISQCRRRDRAFRGYGHGCIRQDRYADIAGGPYCQRLRG